MWSHRNFRSLHFVDHPRVQHTPPGGGSSLLQVALICFEQVQVAMSVDTVRCPKDSVERRFAGARLTHVQIRLQGSKGVLAVSSLAALQSTSSAP